MVGLDNEIRLANLLLVLGEGENDIESFRQKISRNNDFDPYTLFCLVDREMKGWITAEDIRRYLLEYDSLVETEAIQAIIKGSKPRMSFSK
jgi:Ca2+-binding EF-hand superfamily protein